MSARAGRFAVTLVLLGLLAVALAPSCSLPKDELESRLLALPKNAAFAAEGMERVAVTVTADDGPREVTARVVRLPAAASDPQAAARPAVVLVHGTPGSLFSWSDLVFGAGRLAGRAPLVLVDVLGHGITDAEIDELGFQDCADWIVAVLEALDLRDVVLVGHSYGGEFAWRAALDAPDRVARLVLSSSAGYTRADDEWLPEEEAMRELALADIGWWFNSEERVEVALQPHFREDVTGSDRLAEMTAVLDNADNWRAMVDLARDENGDRAAELTELRQPTLLLWGAEDIAYSVDDWARRFAADIPHATLLPLDGAGHYPAEETPAAYAEALLAWIDARAGD